MEPKLFDPNQTLAQRREHWAASLDLFPKGAGALVKDGKYCCLGAACVLAGDNLDECCEVDLYDYPDIAALIGVENGSDIEEWLMSRNDSTEDWAPVQRAIRALAAHTGASEQDALAAMVAAVEAPWCP